MARKNDYIDDDLMQSGGLSGAAGGILRITLLFGSAAVALALVMAPLASRDSQAVVGYSAGHALDTMQTGSIKRAAPVQGNVLQSAPNSLCAIQSNGVKNSDC